MISTTTESGIIENAATKWTDKTFCIRVSAKHLMFASPVFKKSAFLEQGCVEITADSWDLEALLILLRIIHCQLYYVPKQMSFELLAKATVIADYYECHNALCFFFCLTRGFPI